jgi:two-component system, cell cycle sensor histidine kinase and response regulator CckA
MPDHSTANVPDEMRSDLILLVDDEEYIREFVERILLRAGYRVLLASNGVQALEVFKKEGDEISLIILDLMMPEMGGKQCLQELMKLDPNIHVIIASGFMDAHSFTDAEKNAIKGYIAKPYKIDQLLENIRSAIK